MKKSYHSKIVPADEAAMTRRISDLLGSAFAAAVEPFEFHALVGLRGQPQLFDRPPRQQGDIGPGVDQGEDVRDGLIAAVECSQREGRDGGGRSQIFRASHIPGNMDSTNRTVSIWPVSTVASAGPGQ